MLCRFSNLSSIFDTERLQQIAKDLGIDFGSIGAPNIIEELVTKAIGHVTKSLKIVFANRPPKYQHQMLKRARTFSPELSPTR